MSSSKTFQKSQSFRIKDLIIAAMFTAVICVLSQISIPVQPIPFTFSLLAIFLTGALLSPRYALFSVFAYLLIGVVGVPVFAGMKGGPQQLIGYTGGFLAAYPIMAFVTSMFYTYSKKNKVLALAIGMVLSLAICYLLGTVWFTILTENSFYAALTMCVFPFVFFDLIKIAVAISFSIVIRKAVMRNL